MSSPLRNILITGAGSGIGKGIATALAARGHTMLVTDLAKPQAQQVVDEIVSSGGKAHAFSLDVSDSSSVEALMTELPTQPDVLVNNAGIQHVSPLDDFPMDKWQKLVEVMLVGPAAMSKACLPHMKKQNFGRIINIGSIHSVVASKFKTAYVAAKHGLVGFSKVLALETGDVDVTVNTVCPAYVRTPLVDAQISQQAKVHNMTEEEVIQNIFLKPMPKGRFIEYDELTATVEFLMSPAARNITAQTICLDGGWTAQ